MNQPSRASFGTPNPGGTKTRRRARNPGSPLSTVPVAVAVALLLLVAGCSSDESSDGSDDKDDIAELAELNDADPCDEVLEDGEQLPGDYSETVCTVDGELILTAWASYDCSDGSELVWSDLGWAYTEGTFTAFDEDDTEKTPPDSEIDDCLDEGNEEDDEPDEDSEDSDDSEDGTETGSRDNPVPSGTAVEINDWEVTVVGANRDANAAIAAENQFNEPPAPGHQFVLIEVQLTYVGEDDTGRAAALDITFEALGPSNVAYDFEDSCGVTPNELDDFTDVFPGGTIAGNECFSVEVGDLDNLLLIAEAFTFGDSETLFFQVP